jgi:hypothetical protein
LSRDCSLSYRTILRMVWDHKVAAKSSVSFHNLWSQELGQSTSGTDGNSLGFAIVIEIFTQHSRFLQIIQYLMRIHGLPLHLNNG